MLKQTWGVKCLFVSPSFSIFLFLSLLQNSIRHNLSLHSRFVRVQNEGTGKSSWWMLNPEGGKSGKSPRRRAASMDNNSKFTKSRGRAAKKKVNIYINSGYLLSLHFSINSLWKGGWMLVIIQKKLIVVVFLKCFWHKYPLICQT